MSITHKKTLFSAIQSLLLIGLTTLSAQAFADESTELVSVATDGTQAIEGRSWRPHMTGDNRYVVYQSAATNLVPNDTNKFMDIFLFDRQTKETTLISKAADGTLGNGTSRQPRITPDGRYIVYNSAASNLVEGDTNALTDIFVYDRTTQQTKRINVANDGSQANLGSRLPYISDDGMRVSFLSSANNLVPGDTNKFNDIFVRDLKKNTTVRVSVSSTGVQANGSSWKNNISGNGRYVVYQSAAKNLVASDTNKVEDVFVYDLNTKKTTRASVSSAGLQSNNGAWHPSISADGRYVAFWSGANNLVAGDTNFYEDVFVHDRKTKTTTRVSVDSDGKQGRLDSSVPSISRDGRYVAFRSWSAFAPEDDNKVDDIYVHDRTTGTTTLVSKGMDGTSCTPGAPGSIGGPGTNGSRDAVISPNGKTVAFKSLCNDLVPVDTNVLIDVFAHDL
jgi:Tol biopolymer transport system component